MSTNIFRFHLPCSSIVKRVPAQPPLGQKFSLINPPSLMLNDSLLELLFIEHWGEGLVGENNCPSGVARAPLDFATHFLESRRLPILYIW